ncbi:hypothetical protein JK202_11010 [Gluconobacter sp. Dm-62]|uniref:hypothetical protein n=1 Tax=Gluconobacter sp. Dm-62 TaxID=2799804 RepID=UPI001B8C518A|nr:hypothetical protein [Gluconobacter sp. Dm-62]MBS1103538.1 hypothetical protein [Gluconobacter sp. Dm-62]
MKENERELLLNLAAGFQGATNIIRELVNGTADPVRVNFALNSLLNQAKTVAALRQSVLSTDQTPE